MSKCEGYDPPTPQLINNNHINILKNPIVSKTKICNLTITMEVKN